MPTWKTAHFTLCVGLVPFSIVHKLSETGADSIDEAFQYWAENAESLTQDSFIGYLNRTGIVYAMTLEKYKALTENDISDTSLMPFGQHKGKRLVDVPAYYLLLIWDRGWVKHEGVKKYIKDNIQSLTLEANKAKDY